MATLKLQNMTPDKLKAYFNLGDWSKQTQATVSDIKKNFPEIVNYDNFDKQASIPKILADLINYGYVTANDIKFELLEPSKPESVLKNDYVKYSQDFLGFLSQPTVEESGKEVVRKQLETYLKALNDIKVKTTTYLNSNAIGKYSESKTDIPEKDSDVKKFEGGQPFVLLLQQLKKGKIVANNYLFAVIKALISKDPFSAMIKIHKKENELGDSGEAFIEMVQRDLATKLANEGDIDETLQKMSASVNFNKIYTTIISKLVNTTAFRRNIKSPINNDLKTYYTKDWYDVYLSALNFMTFLNYLIWYLNLGYEKIFGSKFNLTSVASTTATTTNITDDKGLETTKDVQKSVTKNTTKTTSPKYDKEKLKDLQNKIYKANSILYGNLEDADNPPDWANDGVLGKNTKWLFDNFKNVARRYDVLKKNITAEPTDSFGEFETQAADIINANPEKFKNLALLVDTGAGTSPHIKTDNVLNFGSFLGVDQLQVNTNVQDYLIDDFLSSPTSKSLTYFTSLLSSISKLSNGFTVSSTKISFKSSLTSHINLSPSNTKYPSYIKSKGLEVSKGVSFKFFKYFLITDSIISLASNLSNNSVSLLQDTLLSSISLKERVGMCI